MNALDRQRGHARLLPFLHSEVDEQVAIFALVVIFDLGFHLRVQKSVCLIKKLHRSRVGFHQPPAESPARSEGPPKNLQPASEQFLVKVLVPGNLDPD